MTWSISSEYEMAIGEKLHSSRFWDQIKQHFFSSGDAVPVLAGLTGAIDQMALQAYAASFAPAFRNNLAMLAGGGFGRRELFPYSHVHILLLVEPASPTSDLPEPPSAFIR